MHWITKGLFGKARAFAISNNALLFLVYLTNLKSYVTQFSFENNTKRENIDTDTDKCTYIV